MKINLFEYFIFLHGPGRTFAPVVYTNLHRGDLAAEELATAVLYFKILCGTKSKYVESEHLMDNMVLIS